MTDIILESIRSLILAGIILYLLKVGRGRSELSQKGWRFVIAGFLLIFFGSTIDITDNFDSLNRFVVIGDTPAQAFIEKMVGYLGGFLVLAIGLVRWIPTITAVEEIQSVAKKLKRTGEALKERNKILQLIFDNVPVMITLYDKEGKIIFSNKALEKILGWRSDELLKINLLEKSYPNLKERKEVLKFMITPVDEWRDFKTTTKEGKVVNTSWYNVRLSGEQNLGIGQDITERIRAMEEIENLAKFPSENPNPVFRISIKDEVILYANSASEPLLKNWKCKVGGKVPNFCWEKVKKSVRSNQSEMFDVSFDNKIFSFVVTPVIDGGYVNLYGRDVTKERKIEEMKSDFVSLVSHQLKTPVAEMRGFVDIMLSGLAGPLTKKQKEYLSDMDTISSRNYKLISNLLDVSRLERGMITVDILPIALSEIVDFIVEEYSEKIEDKGLTLRLKKPDREIMVLADKDKLVEALSNIVHNAFKFTEKGSITISISSERAFGMVTVSDTGRGMSKEVLSHLFKKERVLSGHPEAGSGAGIGLYIAKSFMELQNGDITASSTPGKGSTFIFKIPIAKV